ncbi:hypothetical protein GCM10025868_20040 [Angustibacter aerolatus]|uniref:Uncharacterized protein n=1 Tax=Angustibacter aerolatus TaxID=1162965 RepID=A0ABQ6JHB2_9ACTN|nr:hypothetical protein [Angustibacter aerolatus]GMA86754.1 hypothetical protein GCM10025868_20040 [Angustibacter aerolatus]
MSHDDHRNTLIVEMVNHSNQTTASYQAMHDADLEGVGAVMVLLRHAGIRDDAALRQMSADDQRNTLIVELDAQTRLGRQPAGPVEPRPGAHGPRRPPGRALARERESPSPLDGREGL